MPLRKLISSPEAERDVAPFSGSFTASDTQFRMAPEVQPSKVEIPKVGDYYADYSPLTPEEIAEVDAECAELFKRSKRVSG
jgi:hypothetical protein